MFAAGFISLATAAALVSTPVGDELVDATSLDPRFSIDIKYATTDNFTGEVLYPTARCLVRAEVGKMLVRAQKHLDANRSGFSLLFKDCYRPVSVQKLMWEVVKGTPQQSYVADPYGKTGSVHNYACAVDLTLADKSGKEVDMGTPYDFFGRLAQPRHEERFLREGKLSAKQVEHRRMLRTAMTDAGGFKIIRNEWWHFDAWQGAALRAKYTKLDVPLDAALVRP